MFICIELIFNMSNGSSQLNNSPGLSGADESHFLLVLHLWLSGIKSADCVLRHSFSCLCF